jgi:hypothetical protein
MEARISPVWLLLLVVSPILSVIGAVMAFCFTPAWTQTAAWSPFLIELVVAGFLFLLISPRWRGLSIVAIVSAAVVSAGVAFLSSLLGFQV